MDAGGAEVRGAEGGCGVSGGAGVHQTVETEALAFDCPTHVLSAEPGESLVALEITTLGGRYSDARLRVFIECDGAGAGAMLSASQARKFAAEMIRQADLLEAGATSTVRQ